MPKKRSLWLYKPIIKNRKTLVKGHKRPYFSEKRVYNFQKLRGIFSKYNTVRNLVTEDLWKV